MPAAAPFVPAHLRHLVVEQDYGQYNAIDQAVWRFVLLQTYSRLVETAHPAYRNGLAATGISVERIPNIGEMSDKLGRFGWSAVCVDGFIPPRAFQEFQACGILPIAADIRTRGHLVYTPAPDIIHEAAGHAPILPDPVYAAYLKRIGDLGRKAFTLPSDDAVYRAVYTLSEVKENPTATAEEVASAEAGLRDALAGASEPSEAALLSRLYWWTAEYGLVGKLDDHKIYGAGLLSSLWESHFCHDPSVAKLPLDEQCLRTPYDITQPQPQLFVVEDFEALHGVLDRVERTLAFDVGGELALSRAIRSEGLASLRFSSGGWVTGVVRAAGPDRAHPAWIDVDGPVAFDWEGVVMPEHANLAGVDHTTILTGTLADGQPLKLAAESTFARLAQGSNGRLRMPFASGAAVEGRLDRVARDSEGRVMHVQLSDVKLLLPQAPPRTLERYILFAAGEFVTARAGALDAKVFGDRAFSDKRVPKARELPKAERALLRLYERAQNAHGGGPARMAAAYPRIVAALDKRYPGEWLLRWNMLESLLKARHQGPLSRTLLADLERLEVRFDHREPIASGLRYLSSIAA
jgi:phenylalanine-4-hydroxylase